MEQKLIFLPVLMQVLLTLLVYVGITRAKNRAVTLGQVDESRRALHKDAWPESVQKYTNNLANQFEAPVLFYVLCFVIWATAAANVFALVFSWIFVVSRYVHAYVHTGSNYVPIRKRIFMFGVVNILALLVCAVMGVIG